MADKKKKRPAPAPALELPPRRTRLLAALCYLNDSGACGAGAGRRMRLCGLSAPRQ